MCAKFIRIPTIVIALTLVYGCGSSTWSDAQEADTYEAYQAYVEDNPEGERIAEAKERADSLYWNSIKNDSTANVFETYLDKFPNGQFRSEAQTKVDQLAGISTRGRVTGSNIIIRSNHTTESPSAGVVAKEGTIVQILERYTSGNSSEAILKRSITVVENGNRIKLTSGKAVRILEDRSDSVRASFSTPKYGTVQATISKDEIEAMSGNIWYKIHTNDDITGWIYGKFIEEL